MSLKKKQMKKLSKKALENRRVLISNYIKNIEESFKETAQVKEEKLLKICEAANVEIPDMVKKILMKFYNFTPIY